MSTLAIYGGSSRSDQLISYLKGVDIIVATPGRLLDFLETDEIKVNRVTYFVLDEADRMLDLGFKRDIEKIVSKLPMSRQTLMFSATWPIEVQELAKQYCTDNPVEVKIGSNYLTVNENITHIIHTIEESEKYTKLYSTLFPLLYSSKILIFCSTKVRCDELYSLLVKDSIIPLVLHGDKSQNERLAIITKFRGASNLMIATDVASRGLHINNITHVINYDFPNQIEDYVHRVGRTGRAGSKGKSQS